MISLQATPFISKDEVERAIEEALSNPVNFNFAIDIRGNVYKEVSNELKRDGSKLYWWDLVTVLVIRNRHGLIIFVHTLIFTGCIQLVHFFFTTQAFTKEEIIVFKNFSSGMTASWKSALIQVTNKNFFIGLQILYSHQDQSEISIRKCWLTVRAATVVGRALHSVQPGSFIVEEIPWLIFHVKVQSVNQFIYIFIISQIIGNIFHPNTETTGSDPLSITAH